MPLRFRKSIKLLPWLKVNLSKTGPSLSIGKPGMIYNIDETRGRGTVGLPGSGLSYSDDTPYGQKKVRFGKRHPMLWFIIILVLLAVQYWWQHYR